MVTMYHFPALVFLLSIYLVAVSSAEERDLTQAEKAISEVHSKVMKLKREDLTPETLKIVADAIHDLPRPAYDPVVNEFDDKMRELYSENKDLLKSIGLSDTPPATDSDKSKDEKQDKKPSESQKTPPAPAKTAAVPEKPITLPRTPTESEWKKLDIVSLHLVRSSTFKEENKKPTRPIVAIRPPQFKDPPQ